MLWALSNVRLPVRTVPPTAPERGVPPAVPALRCSVSTPAVVPLIVLPNVMFAPVAAPPVVSIVTLDPSVTAFAKLTAPEAVTLAESAVGPLTASDPTVYGPDPIVTAV